LANELVNRLFAVTEEFQDLSSTRVGDGVINVASERVSHATYLLK
jgi:hypothetical protein